jgi:hypothetical protein
MFNSETKVVEQLVKTVNTSDNDSIRKAIDAVVEMFNQWPEV